MALSVSTDSDEACGTLKLKHYFYVLYLYSEKRSVCSNSVSVGFAVEMSLPALLLLLVFPSVVNTLLTLNGAPSGQTVAPTGLDHLQPRVCSPHSPFYTLQDFACSHSGLTHTVLRVIPPTGPLLARSVSVSQLSSLFASAGAPPLGGAPSPVVVLFHGGPSCEWSRRIWPTWLSAAARHRTLCFVAIDAAADYMLNYNLMVLGFPTIMRVQADRGSETFRGNRTEDELVAWVSAVTDVASMEGSVNEREWLGSPAATLDVRGEGGTEGVNWPLVAANVVSACNVLWFIWSAAAVVRRKVRGKRGEGAEEDVVPAG